MNAKSSSLLTHNRSAWNAEVHKGNVWTIPASAAEIQAAAKGQFSILLTPERPIPSSWMGDVKAKDVLCLASGGGQQGPILAAAGARVTVFDNSDQQLKRDADLAEQYKLDLRTVLGNMQDLGVFKDESFDLIIHPVSNCFIDDILPVWKESYRVLRFGGSLLSGFVNPLMYMIDFDQAERTRKLELVYAIPYSDLRDLSPETKEKYIAEKLPFEFGHSLEDQIQGQISAGFVLTGFYEDRGDELLDRLTGVFIATRALKPTQLPT
jgi:SAM-dependent methyltransferase